MCAQNILKGILNCYLLGKREIRQGVPKENNSFFSVLNFKNVYLFHIIKGGKTLTFYFRPRISQRLMINQIVFINFLFTIQFFFLKIINSKWKRNIKGKHYPEIEISSLMKFTISSLFLC